MITAMYAPHALLVLHAVVVLVAPQPASLQSQSAEVPVKSVRVVGDAAFKPALHNPADPPGRAHLKLQAHLDAGVPGSKWVITQQPFVIDRWWFFEVASADAMDLPTERFVVDAERGVVAKGDMAVLAEIFRTLDILGAGKTKPFNLARIAASMQRSQGSVLDATLLEGIGRPGALAEASLTRSGNAATLVYYEQMAARGLSYTRCQVDLSNGYAVQARCTPYTP